MSELVSVKAAYFGAATALGTIETELIFSGRTRLRSVMIMDTSFEATVGPESFIEFKDGLDFFGTTKLKLYPNLMSALVWIFNSKALFIELPGNGMLFDTGLVCTITLDDVETAGVKSMATSVLYG